MDPDPAVADEVESNAPAPAEGAAPTENPPPTVGQGGGERDREAFLQMMSAWYTEFVRTNPNVRPPPPPPIPQPMPPMPQGVDMIKFHRTPLIEFVNKGLKNLEQILMMMQRKQSSGLKILSGYLMNYLVHLKNV